MRKVILTNQGLKGNGIYIGRHKDPDKGVWGNPFPTKSSSFSSRTYTLEESLKNYEEYIRTKIAIDDKTRSAWAKLFERFKRDGEIVFDCYCTNKEITRPVKPTECHGEVIANLLFEQIGREVKVFPSYGEQIPFPVYLHPSLDLWIKKKAPLEKKEVKNKVLEVYDYIKNSPYKLGSVVAINPETANFEVFPHFLEAKPQYPAMLWLGILVPPITDEKIEKAFQRLPENFDDFLHKWEEFAKKIGGKIQISELKSISI